MEGTIIVTGANGSLGPELVKLLLTQAPRHTIILTVRNPSPESDVHTAKLKEITSSRNEARLSIEALDLGSLAAVRTFADGISQRVAEGRLPRISAIVCNASTWSLNGVKYTSDGYEASFQVNHLAHYLLVLKLLGLMATDGRVILFGSVAHYPNDEKPNPIAKMLTGFPDNVNTLIKPEPDAPDAVHGRGFQRYGTAKLAVVMFMLDLNRRLKDDSKLSNITVLAVNPGDLTDSRAHTEHTPIFKMVLRVADFIMPVIKYLPLSLRKSADGAKDVAELTIGTGYKGCRGYYTGIKPDEPAKASLNAEHQAALWKAAWTWTGMKAGETSLQNVG